MSGITFLVDERGDKTAAVINLRRHRRLWEDFYDTPLRNRGGTSRVSRSLKSVPGSVPRPGRMGELTITFARSRAKIWSALSLTWPAEYWMRLRNFQPTRAHSLRPS